MIENLNLKLKGELPVNREELFILVSSWGRKKGFNNYLESYTIKKCEAKECYDLSNLDVSQITNMSFVFAASIFYGDISKWNTSNVTNMTSMFHNSNFNGNIYNWNVSNVKLFEYMFAFSKFDGDISKFKFNEKASFRDMFYDNIYFSKKYNNRENISSNFLEWFESNKMNISTLNISKNESIDIDNYLSNFNNKSLEIK